MEMIKYMFCMGFLLVLSFVMASGAQAQEVLDLDTFIRLASENDSRFEEILIDELPLRYQKALRLPAKDLVLGVKAQYDVFLDQNRDEADTSLSLSKLFPYTGTDVSVSYKNTPSSSSTTSSSEFTFALTQPIAENAFGAVTRLKDKIIGLENEVARFQIIEAYEDYFAAIITAYMDWYASYENLKIGDSSYQQNLKLMDNIKERQKSSIALPLDVNKIKLQVMAKRETLIQLTEEYQNAL
ncbi:MAG: TolC family protein, partial [Candidatus Omnitrophica bacterium]|nr:TolC family protein [Candidatus Omnitrophota bacterium]